MNLRFIVSLALVSTLACAPVAECNARSQVRSTKTKNASRSGGSLKSIFQNNVGRYPYDVGLLRKPALKARLVKPARAITL